MNPCADDGKHISCKRHYTACDDGLIREWEGRVFMNPPYSQPGVWMKKLQAEIKLERVTEAIALVPAATDTKWLSPVLKSQPVCFWTGRIKFLSEDYQPRNSARQSHVLVYWGLRKERFREVFEPHGFVSLPNHFLEDKPTDRISSRKVREDEEFLLDKSDENISFRKTSDSEKFLEDKPADKISSRKVYEDEKFLEDNSADKISSRKTRRHKGDGSGCIYYRTVTKKGKEYCEAYYQYEIWVMGDRLIKSSRYIPKGTLSKVQQMEVEKAPVKEILRVLRIKC